MTPPREVGAAVASTRASGSFLSERITTLEKIQCVFHAPIRADKRAAVIEALLAAEALTTSSDRPTTVISYQDGFAVAWSSDIEEHGARLSIAPDVVAIFYKNGDRTERAQSSGVYRSVIEANADLAAEFSRLRRDPSRAQAALEQCLKRPNVVADAIVLQKPASREQLLTYVKTRYAIEQRELGEQLTTLLDGYSRMGITSATSPFSDFAAKLARATEEERRTIFAMLGFSNTEVESLQRAMRSAKPSLEEALCRPDSSLYQKCWPAFRAARNARAQFETLARDLSKDCVDPAQLFDIYRRAPWRKNPHAPHTRDASKPISGVVSAYYVAQSAFFAAQKRSETISEVGLSLALFLLSDGLGSVAKAGAPIKTLLQGGASSIPFAAGALHAKDRADLLRSARNLELLGADAVVKAEGTLREKRLQAGLAFATGGSFSYVFPPGLTLFRQSLRSAALGGGTGLAGVASSEEARKRADFPALLARATLIGAATGGVLPVAATLVQQAGSGLLTLLLPKGKTKSYPVESVMETKSGALEAEVMTPEGKRQFRLEGPKEDAHPALFNEAIKLHQEVKTIIATQGVDGVDNHVRLRLDGLIRELAPFALKSEIASALKGMLEAHVTSFIRVAPATSGSLRFRHRAAFEGGFDAVDPKTHAVVGSASVEDGVLLLDVDPGTSQIPGPRIAKELLEVATREYKQRPHSIVEVWLNESDELQLFNSKLKAGVGFEEAAFATQAGARARALGYDTAVLSEAPNANSQVLPDGSLVDAELRFTTLDVLAREVITKAREFCRSQDIAPPFELWVDIQRVAAKLASRPNDPELATLHAQLKEIESDIISAQMALRQTPID